MKRVRDTELTELFQEIHDSFHPKIRKKKIRVLVFGPDLNDDKPSAELRKYILKKCKEDEYIVVLAEHEEIKKLYEKIFRSANDLCKMEYHLARGKVRGRDIIDGIVIIPDSTGSFIELGMFAIEDALHNKILVLFNNDYASSLASNFIGLGAKSAYDSGNARTRLLDYDNNEIAWSEVSSFLDFRKGLKLWRTWKTQK